MTSAAGGSRHGDLRDAAPEYVVGHLEEALARDPRVTEQGLRVAYSPEPPTVVVTGTVVDRSHQASIVDVVRDLLPGAEVRDETAVADYPEADDADEAEELP